MKEKDNTALNESETLLLKLLRELPFEDIALIFDNLPIGIALYDELGERCQYVNARYANAFGWTVTEAIGKSAAELVGETAMEIAEPFIRQIFETHEPVSYVQPTGHDDKNELWGEVILVPKFDSEGRVSKVLQVITDITQQRSAERKLLENERRLMSFMGASEEGIVIHDQGRILDINPALSRLVGRSREELIGTHLYQYVAPSRRANISTRIPRGSTQLFDNVLMRSDGSEIPVDQMGRDVDYHGQRLRAVIVRDARERISTQQRIHHLAHYDDLTSLPNRFHLLELLPDVLESSLKKQQQSALFFLDLDKFKRINDSLGHGAGDTVLKEAAARLRAVLDEKNILARFAGDEFVVLLSGLADRETMRATAQKLIDCLIEPIQVDKLTVQLSACIGIAVHPDHGATADELIAHADAAVLVAKKNGVGSIQFYSTAMSDVAYQAIVMEQELHEALRLNQFVVHYQPQVTGTDKRLIGLEALIRWQHPKRGLQMPVQFLPLAEERQLMKLIGNWVLADVIKTLAQWRAQGLKVVPVSVNMSSQQFEANDFVPQLAELFRQHAVPPEMLELELTERMLMQNVSLVRERLAQLNALGVSVAVDDFGTGYSSLAHLKTYAPDRLKIDQSFVRDLPDAADSAAITRAIVQLAHNLGIKVIAEGVESEAQRKFLVDIGCDDLQGFLFGKAEPALKTGILLG